MGGGLSSTVHVGHYNVSARGGKLACMPHEVQQHLTLFLSAHDIARAEPTCRSLRDVIAHAVANKARDAIGARPVLLRHESWAGVARFVEQAAEGGDDARMLLAAGATTSLHSRRQ